MNDIGHTLFYDVQVFFTVRFAKVQHHLISQLMFIHEPTQFRHRAPLVLDRVLDTDDPFFK
jgi:hypothetical protein